MKYFNILTAAALLFVCQTASAQYDYDYDEYGNPRYIGNQRHYSSYNDDLENGWGSVYLKYAPMQLTSSAKGVDDRTFHSATLGVSYAFRLGYSPAYIEAGYEITGAWFSKRYPGGTKYNMDIYYSKIPVNLAFRFNLSDGFAIIPYGGVNIKWNIYGEEREKDEYGYSQKWRLFDDDYTYDDDYKRFQFGYQAGLKLLIANCFSIGASWEADLTNFCRYYDGYDRREETEKFRGVSFQLAYCF
jgi:hypothetical protein